MIINVLLQLHNYQLPYRYFLSGEYRGLKYWARSCICKFWSLWLCDTDFDGEPCLNILPVLAVTCQIIRLHQLAKRRWTVTDYHGDRSPVCFLTTSRSPESRVLVQFPIHPITLIQTLRVWLSDYTHLKIG